MVRNYEPVSLKITRGKNHVLADQKMENPTQV